MDDIRDLPMPALADEITSLAGNLASGTCRFLGLLAAFDAGGGWHGTGLRSCAQWLSWKCGLSTATAHEQLRVARALAGLPHVRDAFAAGRLSYSKVRALTRVATTTDEQTLVGIATGCTAAQLDRLCAGLARASTDREVIAHKLGSRFTAHWQPDGSLRFSGHLSAEDGAILLAALAAIRSEPEPDAADGEVADRDAADHAGRERQADAAARAARDDAHALVEIARHALATPAPAVGAHPVRLVVHTTDHALAETAEPASPHDPDPSADPDADSDPDSVQQESSAEVWTDQPNAVGVLDAGPGIPLVPLGPATLRRLICQAIVERHAPEGATRDETATTRARYANSRQRRTLLTRDRGCAFPGCPRRRRLHAHHIRHWADGGPTTTDNMALVCEQHHLLIHEGGWQLVRTHCGWAAVDPTGHVHDQAPDVTGDVDQLLDDLALATPPTISGTWAGERLDLSYAVSVLQPT